MSSLEQTKIYLVRHGLTEENKNEFLQGHLDSFLVSEGIGQIVRVSEGLSEFSIDKIVSSDLKRAVETARIIKNQLGVSGKIEEDSRWREINYGIYEGQPKSHIREDYLGYKKDLSYIFPKGESFLELQKRTIDAFKDLIKKHKGKRVVLVSHSGTIRAIASFVLGRDLKEIILDPVSHEYIGEIVSSGEGELSYREINS